MTQEKYTLGATPTIVIDACDGDLEIVGQADDAGTATVMAGALHGAAPRGDQLVVEHCDDVRLTVPRGATIVVQRIAGDARIERLAAARIGEIGGDLDARLIEGGCAVGRVGGDARVSGVTDLALGPVGGDAGLEDLTGTLRLARVDGDAIVRGAVDGFGPTKVGGDLTLDIRFTSGHEYRLDVDGDAAVTLTADADLTLRATVRGDISGVATSDRGATEATWGEGSARLILHAGGDLAVRAFAQARLGTPTSTPDKEAGAGATTPARSRGGRAEDALAVLEAVARGDISAGEADDLLSRPSHR